MINKNMDKDHLIQQLVNALSRSRRYTEKATKDSFRADEVLAETYDALSAAENAGFKCNMIEEESKWIE